MISILIVSVGFVIAGKQLETPAYERAHNGNAQHLYLYEKDSSDWSIVEYGAWGKMMYQDDKFVFNGHKLVPGEDYSLIYYPDINKLILNFECTVGCSGIYTHTMDVINQGVDFSGTGYYNADNSYTWDMECTDEYNFLITYTGTNPGHTIECIEGNCESSSGQKFTLAVTNTGAAVWPHPIEILGTGIVNEDGNVNIKGEFDFASIPWSIDWNEGAKIWLVLSGNIVDDKLSGWNPTEYLFENNLINEDSESASYTEYHGNGIYSTTHILRKGDIEKAAKPVKPVKPTGPACYKLMGPKWASTPNFVAQNEELFGIATTSIGTWDTATGFDLLSEEGSFGDIGNGFDEVMDEKNSYSMGDYPTDGVIAVCRTWWNSNNEIVEYDIMFDTDFTWGDATTMSGVMDLQNIATHEIGHAFGLLDLYQKPCSDVTMFGYSSYGDISKRTLGTGDISGIQALYGTA